MVTSRRSIVFILFVAILGKAVGSVMVRRDAENVTLSASTSTTSTATGSTNSSSLVAPKLNDTTEEGPTETEDEEEEGEDEGEDEGVEPEEPAEGEDVSEEGGESTVPDNGFHTGIVFGSPFRSIREMQQYFFELERALHRVFENTLNEAAGNPNMSNSTTTEEVTVGGHKYLVNRTIITGGDDDSEVVIQAVSIVPAEERRKRAVMEML